MTSLSRISSSALLVAALAAPHARGATVTGRFELTDSRAAAAAKAKNFSGIVVWLEPAQGKPAPPPPKTTTILQKGKKFIPHVSVIPVGSTVDLPNRDPIFHNAFSNFAGQPFDTGLYAPGTSYKVRFKRAGVVRVFCNIHSSMSAVIVVTPTAWYAETNPDGSYRIENVPPGEYVLKVWHERAAEPALAALDRRITVGDTDATAPPAAISESGWSPAPHKNKFGKDYGPEPPDKPVPGYKGR